MAIEHVITHGLPESGLYLISVAGYIYCRDGVFRSVPTPNQLQRYRSLKAAHEEVERLASGQGLLAESDPERPRRPLEQAALGDPLRVKPEAWLYSVEQSEYDASETAHETN